MFIIHVQNFWIKVASRFESNQNLHDSMFYRSPCDVRYVYIVERTSTANAYKTQGDTHMGRECVNEGIIGVNTAHFISPCWLWKCHSLEIFICSSTVFVLDYTRLYVKSFHSDDIIQPSPLCLCLQIYMHDHSVHRIPWWKMYLFNEKKHAYKQTLISKVLTTLIHLVSYLS